MNRIDRRTFLKTSAVASVGVATLGATNRAAASESKRKFTLDLRCGSIGVNAGLDEQIELAQRYGFESLEPSGGGLAKLSESQIDEVLERLAQANLVWGAAGLPVDFRRDEDIFRSGVEGLPKIAKALRRAGVTRIGTWLRPTSDTLSFSENLALHARRLRRVAQVVGEEGLRFGLEYVGPKTSRDGKKYAFVHNMIGVKQLIEAIGRENVGIVLDSWHWYTAHETPADLLTLRNQEVVACDLNDAPSGLAIDEQMDGWRELPAATGVIDLKAFLGALVSIGYDGPVRAEPFNRPLAALDNEPAVAATAAAMKKAFALIE